MTAAPDLDPESKKIRGVYALTPTTRSFCAFSALYTSTKSFMSSTTASLKETMHENVTNGPPLSGSRK
jgi:hypothetical protein